MQILKKLYNGLQPPKHIHQVKQMSMPVFISGSPKELSTGEPGDDSLAESWPR